MIPLFRSGSKLASISAFAMAAFSLLSCGGNGTGEDVGWAPNSPAGYSFAINTLRGPSTGTAPPGTIRMNFTSDNMAIISAPSTLSSPFVTSGPATYIKTDKNSFVIGFDNKDSPSAPPTKTAVFDATCVLTSYNDNEKATEGNVVEWNYKAWTSIDLDDIYEYSSGSNTLISVDFDNSSLQ